ncbi:hypothetical protein DYB36_008516 [Aphanomyces astaci]|uniref:EF-hand domain-containing protein n=1 Tax=Aphanomyces astaci TaxID=112090 RepID=A0A397BE45_APHAT|nr:hypothetical protein DYB36_008516 [Aphanomyces astaci]
MDIMMVLSTDDVKRLKNKFVRPLSVDEFVFIMMKCLHDHIHNETIDVNGDGSLEWDEFAGYIVDAGIAKAEEAIVAQATIKLYSPLVFKGEAANSIQPMAADRTYIQQVTILAGRQALAYYEHASDVVHIYLFGHDRDVEPRFASTIRLHTAYQAHKVLYIEDIATRSSLAISSYLTTGCITVWDVTRLYNPIPLQRVDMAVPQEVLTWVPSHQLVLAATTQSTYKTTANKPQQHQFTFVTALDIATLERVPLDVGVKHVTALCVVKRSTRTAVAIGSMDGTITVHDMAKESQHPSHNIVVDAHEKGGGITLFRTIDDVDLCMGFVELGVKGLTYSVKFGYLASMGHYSFAEESTMEVLVWHFDDENARLCAVTTVDSESHLVSGDEGGMMRVWSVSTWDCLQTFHTSQHISTLRCQVVWPTSPQADALLMCAGKSVEFHDCALVREREEFLFVDFNATFNVILAATYHRLILWDMASGDMRKTYELHVIYNGKPATHSVTAVCLDDRERKLIVGDDAGQVLVVNLVNGNLMKELNPHAQAVRQHFVRRTTDEPPGVLIFAGDEAGQVTRWTLPYDAIVGSGLVANDADGDDDGVTTEATFVTALPSRQPVAATRCSTPSVASTTSSATSGRHTHTDVAWDTMAKSARSAKLASASPAPVASDVQWQVDGGGVTKLAKASVTLDVYSVLTCVTTGKIQAWSVDGVDQGTLDYFATRRQPGKRGVMTTHTRKKRTIHTADTIMERSLSMPTLLLKPAATAAAVKSRKGGSSKGKTPLLSRSTTSTCVLPPLDLRHELAEMALAKQHQVDVADGDSTQSVLSYHLKLAHAWQQ